MVLNLILLIKLELGSSYGDSKIGQGRENSKVFLRDNPEIAKEIEDKILNSMGINDALISSTSDDLEDESEIEE
jgi:recombination protein RecA